MKILVSIGWLLGLASPAWAAGGGSIACGISLDPSAVELPFWRVDARVIEAAVKDPERARLLASLTTIFKTLSPHDFAGLGFLLRREPVAPYLVPPAPAHAAVSGRPLNESDRIIYSLLKNALRNRDFDDFDFSVLFELLRDHPREGVAPLMSEAAWNLADDRILNGVRALSRRSKYTDLFRALLADTDLHQVRAEFRADLPKGEAKSSTLHLIDTVRSSERIIGRLAMGKSLDDVGGVEVEVTLKLIEESYLRDANAAGLYGQIHLHQGFHREAFLIGLDGYLHRMNLLQQVAPQLIDLFDHLIFKTRPLAEHLVYETALAGARRLLNPIQTAFAPPKPAKSAPELKTGPDFVLRLDAPTAPVEKRGPKTRAAPETNPLTPTEALRADVTYDFEFRRDRRRGPQRVRFDAEVVPELNQNVNLRRAFVAALNEGFVQSGQNEGLKTLRAETRRAPAVFGLYAALERGAIVTLDGDVWRVRRVVQAIKLREAVKSF